MNNLYTYSRKALEAEARYSVRDFKRTLPAAIRRTVKPAGWAVRIGGAHVVLLAYFDDENGRHEINIAL